MARAGVTPDRIVETAIALADRDGPDAVTLTAVAAELGIRTPSLYNHVAGLEGLRRELALVGLRRLDDTLRTATVGRAGPDAVRSLCAAYRDFARRHPGLYALIQVAPADDAVRRSAADVVTTVRAALSAYDLSPDVAVHEVRALRAGLHGFVDLERAGGFALPVDLDASFARLVEVLVDGLGRLNEGR
jgi:AcrR family transcriptional regulator